MMKARHNGCAMQWKNRYLTLGRLLSGLFIFVVVFAFPLLARGDATITAQVTITFCYPGLDSDEVYRAYTDDEAKLMNKPTVKTENAEIKKAAEDLLTSWKSGALSAAEFANQLLEKWSANLNPKLLTSDSGCLNASYELKIMPSPSVIPIMIIPYNPQKLDQNEIILPEWTQYLSGRQELFSLYSVKAMSPKLSDKQKTRLLYLAAQIVKAAHASGIRPKNRPDNQTIKQFERMVKDAYDLELPSCVNVTVAENYGLIKVDNFPLIDDIDVRLTNWYETEASLRKAGNIEIARKYEAQRRKRETAIKEGLKHFLPAVPVFTTAHLDGAEKSWEKTALTRFTAHSLESKQGDGLKNVLILEANEPPRKFQVDLSAGLKYSTEKNLQGSASITTDNLANLKDKLIVSAALSHEATDITASWKGTVGTLDDERYSGMFSFDGAYGTDNRVPFGQVSTTRVKEKIWDVRAASSFNFDSFLTLDHAAFEGQVAERKMTRFWSGGTLGIDIKNYLKSGPDNSAMDFDRTSNSITLGLVLGITHDLRSDNRSRWGWGYVSGILRAQLEKGLKIAWGEDDFDKAAFSPGAEVFWGPAKDRQDFFLRVIGKWGLSSGDPPYASLFQLGGQDGVRGLESAELTGDAYIGASEELGVRLSFFCSGGKDAQSSEKKKSGFDLNQYYLKIFHDWVRTDRRGTIPAQSLPGKITVHGFGAALEIEKMSINERQFGKFAFGYAFSPDSELNRRGTLYAELRMEF